MATKPKKYTAAMDDRADKKAGIKEGSKRDNALDKKRGLPPELPGMKNGGKVRGKR